MKYDSKISNCSFYPGAEPAGIRGITKKLLKFLKTYVNYLPFETSDPHGHKNKKHGYTHHEGYHKDYFDHDHHVGYDEHDHSYGPIDFQDLDGINLAFVFDKVVNELHAAYGEGEIDYHDFQTGIKNLNDITSQNKQVYATLPDHAEQINSDGLGHVVYEEVMNELQAALEDGEIDFNAFRKGVVNLKGITNEKSDNGFVNHNIEPPVIELEETSNHIGLNEFDVEPFIHEHIIGNIDLASNPEETFTNDMDNVIVLPDLELTILTPSIDNSFDSDLTGPNNHDNGGHEYDHSDELHEYDHPIGLIENSEDSGPSMFTSEDFHGDIFFNPSVDQPR